ncbi:CoA transferase subunit A [Nonomuraea antri]|uniref:CoA transferase subunit A n=1 Tax=Nonomuraea antri TaxID=2730852 RepID=UPI001C2C797E|nr:CoA-transferase [Nonomuraea antri]
MTVAEVAATVESGMTVGIGGWGSRRKPMALVHGLLRSPVRDLTIVSYGGADVGMLCAAKKVRRVVAPFVTLDSIPLEPHFRAARQAGEIEFTEYDEGMFMFGLLAGAHRLPFLPTRAGLGSDVLRINPELRTVRSPYAGGEELIAVPALTMDVALVHVNRADRRGNAQYLGPDPYFDDLYAKAATRCYVSCERLVDTADLLKEGPVQSLLISRSMVTGVVEAPGGASFTSCEPDYGRDEELQRRYVETPWEEFHEQG